MTVVRGLYLLLFLAFLAVGVIEMRAEQVRVAASIEGLQLRRVELRREAWALQMEISQLRTPQQIRQCVARWALALDGPRPPSESVEAVDMLAAR